MTPKLSKTIDYKFLKYAIKLSDFVEIKLGSQKWFSALHIKYILEKAFKYNKKIFLIIQNFDVIDDDFFSVFKPYILRFL